MAIAALSVGDGTPAVRGRAFGVAVRFACGHAVLLAAGAGAVVLAGWQVPLAVERGGELAAGWMLVCLGAMGLWAALTGRVYGHVHLHGTPPHEGWHLHVGTPLRHPAATRHSRLPTVLGAVFAVSGLRALTLLAPFGGVETASGSFATLLGLVAIFAFGILLAMGLFGVALARAMSSRVLAGLGRSAAGATAVASVGLGLYWIVAV